MVHASFLFSALPGGDKKRAAETMRGPWLVNAGTKIYEQGEAIGSAPGIFFLQRGVLNSYVRDESGDSQPVFKYDKLGQSIGEKSVLFGLPRTTTVVAETEAVVWGLDA